MSKLSTCVVCVKLRKEEMDRQRKQAEEEENDRMKAKQREKVREGWKGCQHCTNTSLTYY